jgi:glutamate--cysteine ligase
MMKATAGCQINLDFSSQAEAMEMLRTATGVSTLVTALCANSPLEAGQANGFMSKRSHVWMHTDPDRCGLLPFALRPDASYESYADYALDVPMMFVVRDDRWIDLQGMPFRVFMGGAAGLVATRADWQLHLTTLFPEVRLKSWLEVRGSDSGTPAMTVAQAALWKGLLYDEGARTAAWDVMKSPSLEERLTFQRDVARRGLRAALCRRPALDLAKEMIELAARGLPPGEAVFLDPLRRVVDAPGDSPASGLLARWRGDWRRRPDHLVEGLRAADCASVDRLALEG